MSQSHKLGVLVNDAQRALARSRLNTINYLATKKSNFLAQPVVRTIDERLRFLVSAENIDNTKIKYDEWYHWLAGTEVSQAQERARYLEMKLNVNRREMRESRENLDGVVERLRNISNEIENTSRGDVRQIQLRQLEYETIQEELKLQRLTQKHEYQERETFTVLMNTVRESHETERNYNQRIKMISMIGAILGPFIGYLFSAWLNAKRFRRMEDIINQKLALLSGSTIAAIREIHGLDPEIVPEPEKRGILKHVLDMYYYVKSLLINAYTIAVMRSSEFLESLKQADGENVEGEADVTPVSAEKVASIKKPEMIDAGTQVTSQPSVIEKVIVEKIIPEPSPPVDYSQLNEFKILLENLETIQSNQSDLKDRLIATQALQESNKIEVSVQSSDEEIIEMLQCDQKLVRELLYSIKSLVGSSQDTFNKSMGSLASSIEGLSKKITNNSELYVASLEHSKIINDLAKSLRDIKENIDLIETYYMNDANKQFNELTKVHGDLSSQILGLTNNLTTHKDVLDTINSSLLTADDRFESIRVQLEDRFDKLSTMIDEIKSDSSSDGTEQLIEGVSNAITDIRTILSTTLIENDEKLTRLNESIPQSIECVLQKIDAVLVADEEAQSNASQGSEDLLSHQKLLEASIRSQKTLIVEEGVKRDNEHSEVLEKLAPLAEAFSGNTASEKASERIQSKPAVIEVQEPEIIDLLEISELSNSSANVNNKSGISKETVILEEPGVSHNSVVLGESRFTEVPGDSESPTEPNNFLGFGNLEKTEITEESELLEAAGVPEMIDYDQEQSGVDSRDTVQEVTSEKPDTEFVGYPGAENDEDPLLVSPGMAYSSFVILTTILLIILR